MESIVVRDPSTGEILADLPSARLGDVARAVARARIAQPAWAARSFDERARLLRSFLRRLRDDPSVLDILCRESGKPRYEAEIFELLYTLDLTRFYCGREGKRALADEVRRPFLFPNKRSRVVYHARGVVGVIGPWNWPLLNNFADAIGPLLAGNAVVLKPSEWTPLTSLRVRELWQAEGLPEDVFQVVLGRADVGRELASEVDMVFFTGSQRAGREVAKAAAERLVPVILELGGKSAMIVLADADLPRAARAAVWSGFAHSGQVCIRTERIFVEEPVAEEFTALCAQEAGRLRHGPSEGSETFDVGAMTFPPQMAHMEAQIADAVAHGARVLVGGKRRTDRAGNYFEPTLLADATIEMRVMTEETFGPVLPIMRVKSAEEALRLTNESTLGLSGSVWSRDAIRARDLAARIESGSVCVNDVLLNYFCVEAPLGGIKGSGLGLRHGSEALRQFCRVETIVEDGPLGKASSLVGRAIGFPYDPSVLRAARFFMKRFY